MILFAASVKNFFSNWHIVIYFFLWRWRGLLDLVHKSRHRRFARHAWYCDPLSFILDTPLSKFCLIYADIFYQISINLIRLTDWPTLYFFFALFYFFLLADSIGKRSHWGFDPSPYPSITTHASVPAYTQSQGLSVTGKFFRSE